MSLFKSIATFGSFTLLSRITGFIRDMVLARFLGAGMIADAFFVAFKLPNLFRSLFAEGAFTSAFVPMVSQKLAGEGKESAIKFASQAISVLAVILTVFVLIMELGMPLIVRLMAPGFSDNPENFELAVSLSRITFPFLLFISIVSFQSGILNSLGKFAAPASAPVILNLMMTGAVFIFVPFGLTPAHGIAFSVTFAGFIEIIWLAYFLHLQKVYIKPQSNIRTIIKEPEIKTLFKRITPGILGAGIYQINMVVDTIIVSLVGAGAISWLYYANRLQQLPLGVVGAAISVAVLPILSKHLKENRREEAERTQNKACEYGALLSIPSAVALIFLSTPIVNILFQHGKFGTLETEMTSMAVIAYSFGLPAYVLVKALTPNFFARGDTRTPVKYSIVVFIANLIFSVSLMPFFGHVGVASATSIAAYVSLYQYVHGLKKRQYWQFDRRLVKQIFKITLSSLIMGGILFASELGLNACYGNWLDQTYGLKILILVGLCLIGVASFAIAAKITGALDIKEIISLVLKKKQKHA